MTAELQRSRPQNPPAFHVPWIPVPVTHHSLSNVQRVQDDLQSCLNQTTHPWHLPGMGSSPSRSSLVTPSTRRFGPYLHTGTCPSCPQNTNEGLHRPSFVSSAHSSLRTATWTPFTAWESGRLPLASAFTGLTCLPGPSTCSVRGRVTDFTPKHQKF